MHLALRCEKGMLSEDISSSSKKSVMVFAISLGSKIRIRRSERKNVEGSAESLEATVDVQALLTYLTAAGKIAARLSCPRRRKRWSLEVSDYFEGKSREAGAKATMSTKSTNKETQLVNKWQG